MTAVKRYEHDQPHLNRGFRAFARSTPTELLARLLPSAPGLGGLTRWTPTP